jgi:hypothetical protein
MVAGTAPVPMWSVFELPGIPDGLPTLRGARRVVAENTTDNASTTIT